MLINTVILLLRDLLPIFILCSFLLATISPQVLPSLWLKKTIFLSVLAVVLLMQVIEPVSDWFDGAGLELLQIIFISLTYLLLVALTLAKRLSASSERVNSLALFAIVFLVLAKGCNFFVFLNVYLQEHAQIVNVLTGVLLGIGICLSFSAIFYYLLIEWQQTKLKSLVYIFWLLFLAGLLSKVVALFAQVNLITMSPAVWNSEFIVQDSSEYGHLLAALVGYESAPSPQYLFIYFFAVAMPLLLTLLCKKSSLFDRRQSHD